MGETLTLEQLRNNSYHLAIRSSLLAIQTTLSLQQTMLQSDHDIFTNIKSTIVAQNTTLQNTTRTLVDYFSKISTFQPPPTPPTPSYATTMGSTTLAPPLASAAAPSVRLPLFSNPPHLNSSTLPLDSYSSPSTPTVILPGSPPPTTLAAHKPSSPPPTTTSTTHLPTTPSSPILSFHQTPPAQCSTLAAGEVAAKETDPSVALDSDLAVVNASEAQPMIQSISKSLASVGKLTKQATASTQQPHLLPSIHVDKHSNPNTILNFAIDNPKHKQIASDISNNLNKPFRSHFAFPSPKNLLEKLTMDLARSNLVDRVSEHTAFLNWENKSFCFQKNEELLDDNWLWFLFISESPIMKSPVDNYVPLLQKGLHSCTTLIDPSAGILILKINRDKLQCESKILIFDPGGTTDRTSSFDLEDRVDFEGSVMIRLYITAHLTTCCCHKTQKDIKILGRYKE